MGGFVLAKMRLVKVTREARIMARLKNPHEGLMVSLDAKVQPSGGEIVLHLSPGGKPYWPPKTFPEESKRLDGKNLWA